MAARCSMFAVAPEANPEFGRCADIPGKPERQFCADTAPPTDKQIKGGWGHPQALGKTRGRKLQRFHELLAQQFARMDRRKPILSLAHEL